MEIKRMHNGIIKVRKGVYRTESGLSIVHDEEDKCWKIIFRHVALHRCPTLRDAKHICTTYYTTEDDAEQALAIRRREAQKNFKKGEKR